jgi:hypothetical protein
MRNLMSLARILGMIDPELLHNLAEELAAQKKQYRPGAQASLWRALTLVGSRDGRRALVGGAAFLQAFGKALRASKPLKLS